MPIFFLTSMWASWYLKSLGCSAGYYQRLGKKGERHHYTMNVLVRSAGWLQAVGDVFSGVFDRYYCQFATEAHD